MKKAMLHIIITMVEGVAKLVMTLVSALIVISLYKTTSSMKVNELLTAYGILLQNETVLQMLLTFLVVLLVCSICELLKRKLIKKCEEE